MSFNIHFIPYKHGGNSTVYSIWFNIQEISILPYNAFMSFVLKHKLSLKLEFPIFIEDELDGCSSYEEMSYYILFIWIMRMINVYNSICISKAG